MEGTLWVETIPPFIDPLRLSWSDTNEDTAYSARELAHGTRFFVDICAAWRKEDEGNDAFDMTRDSKAMPTCILGIVGSPGLYGFTVTVAGNFAKAQMGYVAGLKRQQESREEEATRQYLGRHDATNPIACHAACS